MENPELKPSSDRILSEGQSQTSLVFGHKWAKRDTYDSEAVIAAQKEFYFRHYGDVENAAWWPEYGDAPKILDVGCGAALTALELFGSRLQTSDYTGVDISDAYKVAEQRFEERGLSGHFLRGDMTTLDLPDDHFDVILAEGVFHHTDNTEHAFKSVARHLKKGGRMLAYIYRKKGPIREFTDDYIRTQLAGLSPDASWEALKPLTELGIKLGELNIDIDIESPIDVLGIPAGKINLQRLFYWHIFKAYYRPEWSFDEMHHVNYDWHAPKNAHRHTFEEIEQWCKDCDLEIERADHEELAGYSIIARKR